MTLPRPMLAIATLAACLILPFEAGAGPAEAASKDAKKASSKAASTPAPSAQQIADAQSKGLVWVNLNSKIYHKSGEFYGKTKNGKFMTESDAQKAGYRAAQTPGGSKKAPTKTK